MKRQLRKPFSEKTMDELYGEMNMDSTVRCEKCTSEMNAGDRQWVCPHCSPDDLGDSNVTCKGCGDVHHYIDTLQGYCMCCASDVIRAAEKYVDLRDSEHSYDAQIERTQAWADLKKILGTE